MSQDEIQKLFIENLAGKDLSNATFVMGDMVDKKIIVNSGGIGEQNNYYNSDGELVRQENDEVSDKESDEESDLKDVEQDKAEELRTNAKLRQEKLKDSYAALLKVAIGFTSTV